MATPHVTEMTDRISNLQRAPGFPPVLHIGSDRIGFPLKSAEAKKFQAMALLARHYMLAFAEEWRPRTFEREARFFLLPNLPGQRIRQVLFLFASFVLSVYLGLIKNVQVLISQGVYDALPLLATAKLLRLCGRHACVVVQVHGDWESAATLLGKIPGAAQRWAHQISVYVLRQADVVRVISAFTLAKTRPLIPEGTPTLVFPGFTDIDLFLEDFTPALSSSRSRVIYAGALTTLKGVDVLIEALRRLRDRGVLVDLVVAGEGPQRKALQRLVGEAGLEAHVSFRGFLEQRALRDLIRGSTALVLPSQSEGFGRVLIEAMACTTPVVASRTGGIPELVRHRENGMLVTPDHAGELADALQYLIEHPEEAAAMGRRGRDFVHERFSTAAYFEHYRRLLAAATEVLRSQGVGVRA